MLSPERRCAFGLICLVLAGVGLVPASAHAGALERGKLVLPYGARYVRGDVEVTHRGVDIAAEPGEGVEAIREGHVVFAGSVPTVAGGTMLVVTVRDRDGLLWSYSPLERLVVAEGEDVARGDDVGEVAATGDASSSTPHVHVGLRDEGSYIDPTPHLPAAQPIAPDPPSTGVADGGSQTPASRAENAMTTELTAVSQSRPERGAVAERGSHAYAEAQAEAARAVSPASQPSSVLDAAHLRKIDDHAARSRGVQGSASPAGSAVVPWGWVAQLVAVVCSALVAMPIGHRRQRRVVSEVPLDPRSTRLQPR
jgi:hypothetical protein